MDNAQSGEIRNRIRHMLIWSLGFAAGCLILHSYTFYQFAVGGMRLDAGILAMHSIGYMFLMLSFACYGRMKGRHPALGVFAVLHLFGFIILYFTARRCRACGALHPHRFRECSRCHSPI